MTLLAASCVPRDPFALFTRRWEGTCSTFIGGTARSSSKHPQMDELDTGYTLGELNLLPFGKVESCTHPRPCARTVSQGCAWAGKEGVWCES